MALVKVLRESELSEGQIRGVVAGTRRVAIAKVGGKIYCIDHTCAHKGGPLGDGSMEGEVVTCPWHGWKYDVRNGASTSAPGVSVPTYAVVIKDGEVYVEV